jgi:hypothetical protein
MTMIKSSKPKEKMQIQEKKISEKEEGLDVKYIALVSDEKLKMFNVAKVPHNLDMAKADYFFPIMVDEKRARERYNLS